MCWSLVRRPVCQKLHNYFQKSRLFNNDAQTPSFVQLSRLDDASKIMSAIFCINSFISATHGLGSCRYMSTLISIINIKFAVTVDSTKSLIKSILWIAQGFSHECDFPSARVKSTQLGSRLAITSQKEDLKLAFTLRGGTTRESDNKEAFFFLRCGVRLLGGFGLIT